MIYDSKDTLKNNLPQVCEYIFRSYWNSLKNKKMNISRMEHDFLMKLEKKNLKVCLKDCIFRNDHFLVEAIFKPFAKENIIQNLNR